MLADREPGREATVAYRAVWNGEVIAEGDQTIRLEGNHSFPRLPCGCGS